MYFCIKLYKNKKQIKEKIYKKKKGYEDEKNHIDTHNAGCSCS